MKRYPTYLKPYPEIKHVTVLLLGGNSLDVAERSGLDRRHVRSLPRSIRFQPPEVQKRPETRRKLLWKSRQFAARLREVTSNTKTLTKSRPFAARLREVTSNTKALTKSRQFAARLREVTSNTKNRLKTTTFELLLRYIFQLGTTKRWKCNTICRLRLLLSNILQNSPSES